MTSASAPARMAYLPGSVKFTYRAHEIRTEHYRTWHSPQLDWCWECLDCGDWESSQATRADAIRRVSIAHRGWCHVATGCHCDQPHVTAAMARRLGVTGDYPYKLSGVLFRLAGGVRRHCPTNVDRAGTPYGNCPCSECASAR